MTAATAVRSAAVLSDDRIYRYSLGRRWGDGEHLTFLMLNPSTADAEQDDPTIRRCMGFARREGFSAVHVLNLYAFRATKPANLFAAQGGGIDIVGPKNDEYLYREFVAAVSSARPVVAAWGANARSERVLEVAAIMPNALDLRCLDVTKSQAPRHPLYVSNLMPLMPYDLHPGHARAGT